MRRTLTALFTDIEASTRLWDEHPGTGGPVAAAGLLDDLLNQLMRAGHWAQVWNVVRLTALVAEETGDDDLAYQLAAAANAAELAFPAWPADARAVDEMVERITARRGEAWIRRAGRIAATWSPTDAARAARDGLARIVAA
jgi:class 3 adenylate cyclase